jgi:hypothetical protein
MDITFYLFLLIVAVAAFCVGAEDWIIDNRKNK